MKKCQSVAIAAVAALTVHGAFAAETLISERNISADAAMEMAHTALAACRQPAAAPLRDRTAHRRAARRPAWP